MEIQLEYTSLPPVQSGDKGGKRERPVKRLFLIIEKCGDGKLDQGIGIIRIVKGLWES